MNKSLLVAVITLTSMFFLSSIQMCSAEPTISVEPSYLTVSPGDGFTVNITVDPDGTEIAGADYILRFDNAVLKALNQNKGPFLGGNIMTNDIDNPNGSLDYGEWKMGGGVTDPGVLTTIEFEAISTGISELHFEHVLLSDPDGKRISCVSNNGTCDIGSVGQTPTATPTQTSGGGDNGGQSTSPTQTPIPTSAPSPTQTSGLTSTPTSTATSLPSASPTTDTSQNPGASTPQSEEKSNKLPGFEAVFVITGLLMVTYLILKGKGGNKNE